MGESHQVHSSSECGAVYQGPAVEEQSQGYSSWVQVEGQGPLLSCKEKKGAEGLWCPLIPVMGQALSPNPLEGGGVGSEAGASPSPSL